MFVNTRMTRSWLILFLFVWLAGDGIAQGHPAAYWLEEVAFYADAMVNADEDAHRLRANEALKAAMDSLLSRPDAYTISLDSVRWLAVLHGDGFRIVTWQVNVNPDAYQYEGFIQQPDRLIPLRDTRPFINGAAYATYTPASWYGCLYYQIRPFERDGKTYYLLFGFNAENSLVNTKVADILDLNGPEPKLGVPVFTGSGDPRTRILLTYGDVSTVHIVYDESLGGIVYDHLENLEGIGPAGEALPVADGSLEGWIFKKGDWEYQEKVLDVKSDTPPMLEDRKNRKEDKDILGRPRQ